VIIQLPTSDVEEALANHVAAKFGQPEGSVTVTRLVRKKDGGIEADITFAPAAADKDAS